MASGAKETRVVMVLDANGVKQKMDLDTIAYQDSGTITSTDMSSSRTEIYMSIEELTTITPTDMSSSTVMGTEIYKSKEELVEAVRRKKEAIHRVFKMMKRAEEVDLCFLVDCTGSMSPYINQIKKNIKTNWCERLQGNYKHLKLRVSFVRYTDFDQPVSTRTTWLDFTENVGDFLAFVDGITTPGGVGGDSAEDVFGGLEAVTKLSWRKIGTKVLIHFADAPCHGKQYHNGVSDNHPGGDPDNRDLDEIMSKLYRREIQYHFGFIKESATEKMIEEFDKILLECGEREMVIRTFNTKEPALMSESAYRSVSSSISSTLQKLSSGDKSKGKIRNFILAKAIPKWEELETHNVKVNTSLSTCKSSVDLPTIPKAVKRAQRPFAKGGARLAYHAYFPEEQQHFVMKVFLKTYDEQSCLKRFMEIVHIQTTAAWYASEFNMEKPSGFGVTLEYITCGIMTCEDMDGKQCHYSYEPFIDGDYIKFNGNNGYQSHEADPINDTCQAFSHFTWVKSGKRLVVCDIQGVKKRIKVILTDPAIHDKNVLLYGATNLGVRGIQKFFRGHRCNQICIRMGLEKSPHQP